MAKKKKLKATTAKSVAVAGPKSLASRREKPETPPQDDPSGARELLIQVACELFSEKGLEGTTTRDISRKSGLNISLISYYFGGKVGLYRTIIYEHALKIQKNLAQVVETYKNQEVTREIVIQGISSVIRQFVEVRIHSGPLAKIFMAERIQKMPYAKEVFESIMASTADQIVGMLAEAQKKGIIRNDFPPRSFFMILVESIMGYFMVQDCDLSVWKDSYQLPKDKEKFIEFLTVLLTKGILV